MPTKKRECEQKMSEKKMVREGWVFFAFFIGLLIGALVLSLSLEFGLQDCHTSNKCYNLGFDDGEAYQSISDRYPNCFNPETGEIRKETEYILGQYCVPEYYDALDFKREYERKLDVNAWQNKLEKQKSEITDFDCVKYNEGDKTKFNGDIYLYCLYKFGCKETNDDYAYCYSNYNLKTKMLEDDFAVIEYLISEEECLVKQQAYPKENWKAMHNAFCGKFNVS